MSVSDRGGKKVWQDNISGWERLLIEAEATAVRLYWPADWWGRGDGSLQGEKSMRCSPSLSVSVSSFGASLSLHYNVNLIWINTNVIDLANIFHSVHKRDVFYVFMLSSLVSLSVVFSHFLWHLVNLSPNCSNPQAPLCLPVTRNKSRKQTQLQPHILGSDVDGLMKYPVPINLSPEGRRRMGALIKCS